MPKSGSKIGKGVETPIIGHEYTYVGGSRHWIVINEGRCIEHRHYILRAADNPRDVVEDYIWPNLPNEWLSVEDEFDKFVRETRENVNTPGTRKDK